MHPHTGRVPGASGSTYERCHATSASPAARSRSFTSTCARCSRAGIMASQDIEYSEKYFDDDFEYRCARFLPFSTGLRAPAADQLSLWMLACAARAAT